MNLPLQLWANNAASLLQFSISPTDSTIQLQPGLGSKFPQPLNLAEFFLVTLENKNLPTTREIIKVTGRTGDFLTGLIRGWENTTPRSWQAGITLIDHRITAGAMHAIASGATCVIHPSIVVQAAATANIVTIPYSSQIRLHKFWINVQDENAGLSTSFEFLSNIQGLPSNNSETVDWVQTHRVGYKFPGTCQITLNTLNKQLVLNWSNLHDNPVAVRVTSL